ncbi:hypothetical protein BDW59DRAFT_54949 [Aspergillus cavernicola]|uniref:Uncharacterized protein n=1 Tax=Aspergillus cavernicola TaxID=176166 RepID=A0ABR4IJA6_9EURO
MSDGIRLSQTVILLFGALGLFPLRLSHQLRDVYRLLVPMAVSCPPHAPVRTSLPKYFCPSWQTMRH